MKSAVDLLNSGTMLAELRTRSGIMRLWLRNRLKAEASPNARISDTQFHCCLSLIAKAAAANQNAWISVDEISNVPRFEPSKPPGPVVERLISANILETHPERPDHIRFSFEAVYDFFLADSMVTEIEREPIATASAFAQTSLSRSVTRLECIGDQIMSRQGAEEFIRALATHDGPMAAVVLRPGINSYSSSCRELVVSAVAKLLASRMTAERALATEILGRLKCPESTCTLESYWTANTPSNRLHGLVSGAAISHGIIGLVPLVFQTSWFTDDRYFVDLRPELFATSDAFRQALATYATRFIPAMVHSLDYERALTVLAYLGDDRAVDAIKLRTKTQLPYHYESMCLLVIGSTKSVELYSSLVSRYLIAPQEGTKELESRRSAIVPWGAIGSFATKELEEYVVGQIASEIVERQMVGRQLATKIGTDRLLELVVKHWRIKGYSFIGGDDQVGTRMGCDKWIELWNRNLPTDQRRALIEMARALRDTRIESALIECLSNSDLAGSCAQALSMMGSDRACQAIRKLLATRPAENEANGWSQEMAFRALARLRDPSSVPELVSFLESDNGANHYEGTVGLASIGTPEAETALLELRRQSDERLVRGLVSFGSRKCVERAVEIARRHENGPEWLVENCRFSFGMLFHGKCRHQFRTDVEIDPLLEFVATARATTEFCENMYSILDDIDSPSVRKWLRNWYALRRTDRDVLLKSPNNGTRISDRAYRTLSERGDQSVLTEFVKEQVERIEGHAIHEWAIRDLGVFDREGVRSALRSMLESDLGDKTRVAVLDLIGHFGDISDLILLNSFISTASAAIANAAFEARLRLSDPLRLTENW
jgi:hypothetical protein